MKGRGERQSGRNGEEGGREEWICEFKQGKGRREEGGGEMT